jgi:transposase
LRKGSLYLVLGEQIGHIFEDDDFRDLYALQGEPALSPAQLTLVLILQALEGLSDREAAEAVRARIDWKYALHLHLEDQGFDFSVLADFRDRLVSHEAGTRVLDHLLQRMRALQLLKERGKQRTDASYVLSGARALNRLELVWESMWVTLESLAKVAPTWLRGVALPHWGERYDIAWRGSRLPKGKEQRSALAASIGADGAHLLAAGHARGAPREVAECAAFQLLEKIWAQQYEQRAEGWRWRAAGTLPAGAELIQTPYDAEARYGEHHEHSWKGYAVHFTETCDPDSPRLITHVEVTPAAQTEVETLADIHRGLQKSQCLPQTHLADTGYVAGHTIQESKHDYDIGLIGPVQESTSWQAKQGGFTPEQFQIDWPQKRAICPEGQTSSCWSESHNSFAQPIVHIAFPRAACHSCASRCRCTRAKGGRTLGLSPSFVSIVKARQYQQTPEFAALYAQRAGIEATISEAVRKHGARVSRYLGLKKTWLQQILLAAAINLERATRWLRGLKPKSTRTSHFAMLMAAA